MFINPSSHRHTFWNSHAFLGWKPGSRGDRNKIFLDLSCYGCLELLESGLDGSSIWFVVHLYHQCSGLFQSIILFQPILDPNSALMILYHWVYYLGCIQQHHHHFQVGASNHFNMIWLTPIYIVPLSNIESIQVSVVGNVYSIASIAVVLEYYMYFKKPKECCREWSSLCSLDSLITLQCEKVGLPV